MLNEMLLLFVETVETAIVVIAVIVVELELGFIESFIDSLKQLYKVDFIISAENLIAEKTHVLRS